MILGQTIKKFRLASGLSQGQLGELVGVSASHVSLIERGKREPALSVIRRIAAQLKIPFGLLLAAALDVSRTDGEPARGKQLPPDREALYTLIDAVRLALLTRAAEAEQRPLFDEPVAAEHADQ